jgi:hypothetical protein
MSKRRLSIHVVPRGKEWAVQSSESGRAHRVTTTKAEATAIAREVAMRQQAELVIHGRNGQIQDADSFGGDPHPPRDRKH